MPLDVQTLYDAPWSFTCNGSFCGGNVPEAFFPAEGPIPSQPGPNIPRSLELRGHYSNGDGDIGVLTAVAAMRAQMMGVANASGTTSATRDRVGRGGDRSADAALVPRFLLKIGDLNVLALITLAIDGPSGSLLGQISETTSMGLPIGPLTRNGGPVAGSLSDFGLPQPLIPAGLQSRGLPGIACAMQQVGELPIYRAMIDPTPVPMQPDTAEQVFPLYPPPGDPPPFEIGIEFRSIEIPAVSFGGPFSPAPSLVGPQADTELRVEHNFALAGECVLALASVYVVPEEGVEPSPTPTNTPTSTPTSTPTETPTTTPTATSTPTATETPIPTSTPTPSNTPTATPIPSDTPTASNTPTITNTPDVLAPVVPEIPTLSGVGVAVLLLVLLGAALAFLARGRGQS